MGAQTNINDTTLVEKVINIIEKTKDNKDFVDTFIDNVKIPSKIKITRTGSILK